jgi:hypothetical protein
MILPHLNNTERYAGLYVVDFGDSCAVGYTVEEVRMIIESEAHADAKVYRIVRARPDGTMELRGVPRQRFTAEAGLFFYHRVRADASADYQRLRDQAGRTPLPCKAQLMLGAMPAGSRLPYVVGLAYAAECEDDVAGWMLDNAADAGEVADGGASLLATMRGQLQVLESCQLLANPARASRSREEVLASTSQPVQRVA